MSLQFAGSQASRPSLQRKLISPAPFFGALDLQRKPFYDKKFPTASGEALKRGGINHQSSVEIRSKSRRKLRILVTAGPTREPIDPIRFISNYSTGKMGYELAAAAIRKGHRVTLISGPTHLIPPKGAKSILATTTHQMKNAIKKNFAVNDCLIMAAAVSDFRPAKTVMKKIKKEAPIQFLSSPTRKLVLGDLPLAKMRRNLNCQKGQKSKKFFLRLEKTSDILLAVGRKKGKKILVGFALETEDLIANAIRKLRKKNLDLIVANQIGSEGIPFGDRKTGVLIVDKSGRVEDIPPSSKRKIAKILLDKVEALWYG